MARIIYQGVSGSFSHITAERRFGKNHTYIGKNTFSEVFEALKAKKADYACLPIENSLIGSIYENYDLLTSYDFPIIGEAYTRIELCLLVVPGTKVENIKKVYSHPKALQQCQRFFQRTPALEAVAHADTAGAAADIATAAKPAYAAIASKRAAEHYGLEIIKSNIEDDAQNYTRFFFLSSSSLATCEDEDKCSLMFTLQHAQGELARVLTSLTQAGLNLTKIESRPLIGRPFEYLFYVDVEGKIPQTIPIPKGKILGKYQRGSL